MKDNTAFILYILILATAFIIGIAINKHYDYNEKLLRAKQDSTENAHLKRELRKCNSDSTHKDCIMYKTK